MPLLPVLILVILVVGVLKLFSPQIAFALSFWLVDTWCSATSPHSLHTSSPRELFISMLLLPHSSHFSVIISPSSSFFLQHDCAKQTKSNGLLADNRLAGLYLCPAKYLNSTIHVNNS